MEEEAPIKKEKKPRSEAQKAATAKALSALKARREITHDVIKQKEEEMLAEAEEKLIGKIMTRMGVIKKDEEEKVEVKQVIKQAKKPKKVVIVEEESSSEEEVVVQKVKKAKAPKVEVPEVIKPKVSTGNKLLDRLYGL